MTELETLQQQKTELLEKIQQIAENCEGIDNPENAAKVTELNGRQSELMAQKSKLQTNLSALDNELGNIAKNIRDLSGSGIEKILEAIKNQRWYFFKNKPKVLMDRDTALLWADLNYFPYCQEGEYQYSYDEAVELVENLTLAGYENWKLAKLDTLYSIEDMPNFQDKFSDHLSHADGYVMPGSNWLSSIKGVVRYFKIEYRNNSYDFINNENVSGTSGYVIPCSDVLVPQDYENNISPSNNFYSETEKLQFTLDIFVQNDLIPIFDDAEITQLYRQIYIEKPALMKQLAELDEKITELQKNEVRLTANFNYKPLLAKYDVKAIDNSVIQYYEAVLSTFCRNMKRNRKRQSENFQTLP